MRNRAKFFLTVCIAGIPAGSSIAGDDERAAVLAVVQQSYNAVRSQVADDMRAVVVPEGNIFSLRPDPDGEPGDLEMRLATHESFLAGIPPTDVDLVERWTAEPTVLIRGPIAMVWGDYEFIVDGNFSHCGGTLMDLAKIDGQWKIVNWSYTVEYEGCPTRPSE